MLPSFVPTKDLDEVREIRLQLLNYENNILRERTTQLNQEIGEMAKKINELEASFDLLGDMLVQCIKHLQTQDAKTIVAQILAAVAKVNAPSAAATGGSAAAAADHAPSSPRPLSLTSSQLSSSESSLNMSAAAANMATPAPAPPPPPTKLPSKTRVPQLSLAQVEPSAWLRGEPTAGDVYQA